MTQPQVIQGTGEQLLPILEKYRNRANLMLIIPSEDGNSTPPELTEEDIARADARLEETIVSLGRKIGANNEEIDADLARAYEGNPVSSSGNQEPA